MSVSQSRSAGGTSSTNIGIAGNISSTLHAAFTDYVQVNGNAINAGRLRLAEDTDNGSNYVEIIAPSAVTSNRVITLPDATTMLGTDTTATVTNKTIDGDNNTLSNLDIGNEVDWAAAGDVSDASAFESGDKMLIFEAGVGLRKIDYDDLPSGSGDVTGPASSTDNAVARFDSTTGKIIQNSVVTIGDTGDINSEGQLTIGTSTQGSRS